MDLKNTFLRQMYTYLKGNHSDLTSGAVNIFLQKIPCKDLQNWILLEAIYHVAFQHFMASADTIKRFGKIQQANTSTITKTLCPFVESIYDTKLTSQPWEKLHIKVQVHPSIEDVSIFHQPEAYFLLSPN